jgi:NAD-dependent SIR2 family protein deacetylase
MRTVHPFAQAARLLEACDGLTVTAGAGMGVDSGLPDFRGAEGFWRAYPALARAGIAFTSIASPQAFRKNPRQAWGFYGHRLALYRRTPPHAGFALLKQWGQARPAGVRVFTSNVDGHFQAAGFEHVVECHGSIHHLQCLRPCSDDVWPAEGFHPEVDESRCELLNELPVCPRCGGLARPNILMFGDDGWIGDRYGSGELRHWLRTLRQPLVIELGAGTSVPTVRWFSESVGGGLIRINPREPEGADVRLPLNALEALGRIQALLSLIEK